MSQEERLNQSVLNGTYPFYESDKMKMVDGVPPRGPQPPQTLTLTPNQGPLRTPQANGFDSSNSSRNSSPGIRMQQIPASQLPPARHPTTIGQLTSNYDQMKLSGPSPARSTNTNDARTFSSPSDGAKRFPSQYATVSGPNPVQESNKCELERTNNSSLPLANAEQSVSSFFDKPAQQSKSPTPNVVVSQTAQTNGPIQGVYDFGTSSQGHQPPATNNASKPAPSVGYAQQQQQQQAPTGASTISGYPQKPQGIPASTQQMSGNPQRQAEVVNLKQAPPPTTATTTTAGYPQRFQQTPAATVGYPQQQQQQQQPVVATTGPLQRTQQPPVTAGYAQQTQPSQFQQHPPATTTGYQQQVERNPPSLQQTSATTAGFPQPQTTIGYPQQHQRTPTTNARFPQPMAPTAGYFTQQQATSTGYQQQQQQQPRPPASFQQAQPLATGYSRQTQPAAFQQPPAAPTTTGYQQQVQGHPPSFQPPPALTQQQPPILSPVNSSQPNITRPNLHSNRYPMPNYTQKPTLPVNQPQTNVNQNQNAFNYQKTPFMQPVQLPQEIQQPTPASQPYSRMGVTQMGFSRGWGHENIDLLQTPNILPPTPVEAPKVCLGQEALDSANCSTKIFRCTVTRIPESNSLLQKARLPLGVLIHPFKDLEHLTVIQCDNIVRCRACRTYINPFVFFVDSKRWKCNLCYRVNDLPEQFQYDPVTKTYGDPSRRPEIKTSTIEYIAPAEYMVRPPQPAVYLFLLDVSQSAVESGYLHVLCNVLQANLSSLPGDARTQIGFIAYNSCVHFYSLCEGFSQPHEMTVIDLDDIFLPFPDNLLVNLKECKDLVEDLLQMLPTRFANSYDNSSALGAALQAAHKMITNTGGRITVFQATLPNIGPGALPQREDPNQRASNEVHHLTPANDFYKRLALECNSQQIAVDVFLVNSQYVDLATISGVCTFSGGCMYHFPLFKVSRPMQAEKFERTLKRYLLRKIGFEAVMRIRCTRGLSIHTFHGNFFVRSSDLLLLPNVNPDAGFGMQLVIDENLSDLKSVCFQAALLYTSSKGDRRIRVHTLCVPIANTLQDVLHSADQQCIIGLLSKMAVDRSIQSSLSDAREAFINVAIDILSSYKMSLNLESGSSALLVPHCLKLLPLYISALLKHPAFRTGTATRLDDRVKAMCDMKTLPLPILMQEIYPDLYPVHNLEEAPVGVAGSGTEDVPQPPRLQLTARSVDSRGAYLMDMGDSMLIYVGSNVTREFLNDALGVPDFAAISEQMQELPLLETAHSQRLNSFVRYLNGEKPFDASLQVIRENSQYRSVFIERLIEDRVETALSYHEFLQHLKTQVK